MDFTVPLNVFLINIIIYTKSMILMSPLQSESKSNDYNCHLSFLQIQNTSLLNQKKKLEGDTS